ncbi:hypothetical protein C0Q70_02555 [Pomacea canaliculata]|uniref:G-protein coupled receptors family 1 profile domain-containing protein n=1 Tax=Pomacea canaliculata TaxID=400727 RepID=A0A2T7PQ92_POMCA|nr:hypothetical protein C0Q70_02555 [Pomacea canaliculata]
MANPPPKIRRCSAHLREEIEREKRQLMEEGLNSTTPVNGEMVALLSMLSLFTVVGTVGNGLVLFVFSRVRDKTTAQLFILTLALIDLFTCLVIIPFTMFVEFTRYDINYDLLCKLYQFLITSKFLCQRS